MSSNGLAAERSPICPNALRILVVSTKTGLFDKRNFEKFGHERHHQPLHEFESHSIEPQKGLSKCGRIVATILWVAVLRFLL